MMITMNSIVTSSYRVNFPDSLKFVRDKCQCQWFDLFIYFTSMKWQIFLLFRFGLVRVGSD